MIALSIISPNNILNKQDYMQTLVTTLLLTVLDGSPIGLSQETIENNEVVS